MHQFCQVTTLKPRTAQKHLSHLINRGYIVDQGNGHYRCVGQKKLLGSSKRQWNFKISDKELFDCCPIKIVPWRALLDEALIQRAKDKQAAIVKGFTIVNERDKSREKIRKSDLKKWVNLVSVHYAAAVTGFCPSTIWKHRKRQTVSRYTSRTKVFAPGSSRSESAGEEIVGADFLGKILPFGGKLTFFPVSTRISSVRLRRN